MSADDMFNARVIALEQAVRQSQDLNLPPTLIVDTAERFYEYLVKE